MTHASRPPRWLFVCTGNTCRSPMAAALAAKIAGERAITLDIRSAGVATVDGLPPSEHASSILIENGIQQLPSSTALTYELVQWADAIWTMTEGHRKHVLLRFPEAQDKTYVLDDAGDIRDPYGASLSTYRACAAQIEQALMKLLSS